MIFMVKLIFLCVSAPLREKKFSHKKAQEVQRWKEDGAGKMLSTTNYTDTHEWGEGGEDEPRRNAENAREGEKRRGRFNYKLREWARIRGERCLARGRDCGLGVEDVNG
jgi:hypothetical protein